MRKGWDVKSLGQLAKISYGYTEKASFNNIGPKFLRITDIQDGHVNWRSVPYCKIDKDNLAKHLLQNGDIVFARTGATTGKSYFITNPPQAVCASYLIKVQVTHPQVLPEYIHLFFQTQQYWDVVNAGTTGSAQGGFNASKLSELNIPFPSLPEQKQIIKTLDQAFAVINKAKTNAERNVKNAKVLFESYLNNVFENIGEEWEKRRVEEVCKLVNGRAYKKTELLNNGKYRVLRVGNFFTNDQWYYSDLELAADKYCDKNDLLYAWSASFGPKIWGGEKVIYHYHIWKIEPNEKIIIKELLFYLLEWDKEKIKRDHGAGATMLHVSKSSMEKRVLPIPPLKQQKGIVCDLQQMIENTQELQAIYEQKILDLEELKKSILQKAFNGELTNKLIPVHV